MAHWHGDDASRVTPQARAAFQRFELEAKAAEARFNLWVALLLNAVVVAAAGGLILAWTQGWFRLLNLAADDSEFLAPAALVVAFVVIYAGAHLYRCWEAYQVSSLTMRGFERLYQELGADHFDPERNDASDSPSARGLANKDLSDEVFIVHGHDEAAKHAIANHLYSLGLKPIILHEQPNQGRAIIEKFEDHADVGFAVILMTPDDVGGPSGGEMQPRARQNVILELGYFAGRLGRDRVCLLVSGETERPSDILGVGYVEVDAIGAWKQQLGTELKAAGYRLS
ncbi:MAG: nucleotide-binding protein [Pseudomonadota bacterium]